MRFWQKFQPLPHPIEGGSAVVSPDEKYAIIIPTYLHNSTSRLKETVFLMDGKTFDIKGNHLCKMFCMFLNQIENKIDPWLKWIKHAFSNIAGIRNSTSKQ